MFEINSDYNSKDDKYLNMHLKIPYLPTKMLIDFHIEFTKPLMFFMVFSASMCFVSFLFLGYPKVRLVQ